MRPSLTQLHLAALALFVAACAPGKSIVTVTIDADAAAPVGPIASLAVTPTDAAGHKDTVTVPVNASVPPAVTFSLRFDASVKGSIHVAVLALDASGMAVGGAAGDVVVTPSHVATLALRLTGVVPPPAGAMTSFTTQPMDTLAKTVLAPVRVAIVDAGGSAVTNTNVPITLALGANPSGATLGGTLTVAAAQGVATFSDLTVDKTGNGYTLVASAPATADGTSAPFNIKTSGFVASNAGLSGGVINDLVMDPKHTATLYAATADNGVWKTIDSGNSWTRAASGLPRRHSIDALAIDPVTTTTLWASGGDAGVYKSTDGGNSWMQSYPMAVDGTMYAAIAVDPTHPMNVYVANGRALVHTSNGGTSWATIATNASYGPGPRSIAIHPSTGDVWVAQFGDGLAKMAFGANTFTAANGTGANIIPGMHPYMKCIAFDPYDPTFMYASGDITPTVFTSSDGGANWIAAATAPAHAPVRMAGYVGAGGIVRMFGAVPEEGVVSTPVARNKWDYGSAGITGAVAVQPDPNSASLVYAGNSVGVWRSTDAFNFTGRYDGLIGHGVYTITVDPKNGAKIYVGMRNGVYRSSDGAQSWSPATSAMPGNTDVYALGVDYSDGKQLYLGTSNWGYHSADYGANWAAVTYGGTVLPIYSLAASPSVSGTFWAGGNGGDVYSIASGATTWSPASSGLPATSRMVALAVHPSSPMTVWAATSAGGVYKTVNGGAMWTASNGGLGSLILDGIALDPTTPTTLYVATADKGVYKSVDGGASWSAASNGLPSMVVNAIALAPSQPATLYAATPLGFAQSLDAGVTWASYNTGLASGDLTALAVDAQNPLNVYVSTWDGGVFKNVTQ